MRINITLGHNSSAALFRDGKCVCAYEEERLTKVKSDSSFPKLAIEKCLEFCSPYEVTEIGISDWFDTHGDENKYYLPKYLSRRLPNAQIVDNTMTHHDQHAQSVWNFSGITEGLTVVIDGFGNNQEVISIYRGGEIIHRSYGYENSLGLMFQYATSAAGLKENEDEYKLLGYEIHSTITPKVLTMPPAHKVDVDNPDTELINYKKLANVREYWHKQFKGMSREDIAKTAQANLELKVLNIIKEYLLPTDEFLQLSGGVFYNVKLNNLIMRKCPSAVLVVNPVCGDQGNVFGFKGCEYDDLYLGKRDIIDILPELNKDITTAFMGHMEFGPRALGNTSTLALPTMENVKTINTYNHRDTVMPMAPIVTREFFEENFHGVGRVLLSERYMVVSFDYKTMKDEWRGAAHYDPERDVYTGRVQVIDEEHRLHCYIKARGGIMINTSLNFHGTPILYDGEDLRHYNDLIS